MAVLNRTSVAFKELAQEFGLEEGSDERGGWVRKPYLVAYKDRIQFILDVWGLSKFNGPVSHGNWTITTPWRYPESPNLYAAGVQIKGVGDMIGDNPIQYDMAIVMVYFQAPNWGAIDIPPPNDFTSGGENGGLLFSEMTLDMGKGYASSRNTTLFYGSDVKPVQGSFSRSWDIQRLTITYFQFPYLPAGKFRGYADTTNSGTFLGASKGQVKCEPIQTQRTFMSDGSTTNKITLHLAWRQQDWNMVVRHDNLNWDFLMDKQANQIITLPYTDYSGLLLSAGATIL